MPVCLLSGVHIVLCLYLWAVEVWRGSVEVSGWWSGLCRTYGSWRDPGTKRKPLNSVKAQRLSPKGQRWWPAVCKVRGKRKTSTHCDALKLLKLLPELPWKTLNKHTHTHTQMIITLTTCDYKNSGKTKVFVLIFQCWGCDLETSSTVTN